MHHEQKPDLACVQRDPRASPTLPHASYTHDPHRTFGYSSGPGRVSPVGNCLPCHQERYLKSDQRCGTFFPLPHQLFRAVPARQGCAWKITSSRFSGFGCQRMWLAQIHSELPHMWVASWSLLGGGPWTAAHIQRCSRTMRRRPDPVRGQVKSFRVFFMPDGGWVRRPCTRM